MGPQELSQGEGWKNRDGGARESGVGTYATNGLCHRSVQSLYSAFKILSLNNCLIIDCYEARLVEVWLFLLKLSGVFYFVTMKIVLLTISIFVITSLSLELHYYKKKWRRLLAP